MLERRNNNEHWGTISICTVLSSRSVILLVSVAGRDFFQMPAQQQAVDVVCNPFDSLKVQQTILTFILLLCLTSCHLSGSGYFTDYKSEKIVSPTTKYYITTTVNRTNNKKDDFGDVVLHLYNFKGQLLSDFNTDAGDANKWAIGWDRTKDIIILFSSDIGNAAYKIENEKLKSADLTDELNKRASELKEEKYKQ